MWSAGFRSTFLSNCTEPIRLFIFSFLRQSSKTNWCCCNEELRLNYPLNPALHIAFVSGSLFLSIVLQHKFQLPSSFRFEISLHTPQSHKCISGLVLHLLTKYLTKHWQLRLVFLLLPQVFENCPQRFPISC